MTLTLRVNQATLKLLVALRTYSIREIRLGVFRSSDLGFRKDRNNEWLLQTCIINNHGEASKVCLLQEHLGTGGSLQSLQQAAQAAQEAAMSAAAAATRRGEMAHLGEGLYHPQVVSSLILPSALIAQESCGPNSRFLIFPYSLGIKAKQI